VDLGIYNQLIKGLRNEDPHDVYSVLHTQNRYSTCAMQPPFPVHTCIRSLIILSTLIRYIFVINAVLPQCIRDSFAIYQVYIPSVRYQFVKYVNLEICNVICLFEWNMCCRLEEDGFLIDCSIKSLEPDEVLDFDHQCP